MKNKKHKGTISIIIVLMIIFMISIGLVFYDFTRLSTSRENIDRTITKAMDSALVEYDENIYSKYNLMVISNQKNIGDIIKQRLDLSLNSRNVKKDRSLYKIIEINTKVGANLNEEKAIKRAIIRSHQKKFVANKVSEWVDKLEILEMIPEYSKSMKLYSKSIKTIAKLKDEYDNLREKSENLLKKYEVIKGINIKNCLNTIISIKDDIKKLKDEKNELRKEKREIRRNSEGSCKEEIDSINEEIKTINQEISDLKNEITDLLEDIDKVKELVKMLKSYSNKLQDFCEDLNSKSKDLREDINEVDFSKNEKMQTIVEKVSKILLRLENASNKVSDVSKKTEVLAIKMEKNIKTIDSHLKNSERLLNNLSFDLLNIKDINTDSLISIFGDKTIDGNGGVKQILDFIWESIAGDYLPQFDQLNDIDEAIFKDLPSNTCSSNTKNFKKIDDKPNSNTKLANNSLKIYEENSAKNEELKIGEKTNQFFQKLIIADYVVETFSNINDETNSKNSSPIKAESEYILSGSKSTKVNVLITQGKIYSLRMVLNGISILIYKQVEINEMATSLSSVTGFLGYPLAYGLVSLGWSAIESSQDIKALNSGGYIPILKMQNEIKTDLKNIIDKVGIENFKDKIKQKTENSLNSILESKNSENNNKHDKKTKNSKQAKNTSLKNDSNLEIKNPLTMNYKDHLILFLLVESETETLLRISDLICIKENLHTKNYSSVIKTNIKVDIPVLFNSSKKKLDNSKKKSYLYEVETIRGY